MRAPILLALGLVSGLAACGGDDAVSDDSNEMVDCSLITDADEFTVGLTKPGFDGVLEFSLMSANPAPPSRGDNVWLLEVKESGVPSDGEAITVFPFMPKHGHTTPTPAIVTPAGTPGQYTLDPVNFWMPGVWEVTIDATKGEPARTDSALFRFCIPS
jgi:hypothetical protein